MEGSKGFGENGSSSDGRPPNPVGAARRQCFSVDGGPCNKTLARHQSLVKTKTSDISSHHELGVEYHDSGFMPIIRSGAWADIGFRSCMEDVYLRIDNFMSNYGLKNVVDQPNAFYGVPDLPFLYSRLFTSYFVSFDVNYF
uniref:Uncharacterized protein n=1 Tax=Rhizophora mucronata TaxID=61149 RepID=A0A2P2J6I0_RHIMU